MWSFRVLPSSTKFFRRALQFTARSFLDTLPHSLRSLQGCLHPFARRNSSRTEALYIQLCRKNFNVLSGKTLIFTCFIFFGYLFYPKPVFADLIFFKNGNRVEGIITKENESSVEFEINLDAKITLSKRDIEKVERQSEEENRQIRERWVRERQRREGAEIVKRSFEEEQLAKGLVKYRDEWVTPEEMERLQTQGLVRELSKEISDRKFSANEGERSRSEYAKTLLKRGDWRIRETKNFSVFYKDLSQAKLVSDKAEYYFEKIAYDLNYEREIKTDRKCEVYIVETKEAWEEFLKKVGLNPALIGGFVSNYKEREIFLCGSSPEYLVVAFPHELTHLIFREFAGGKEIPLWLNEGLANYEGAIMSFSNELLEDRIREGKHILIGELTRFAGYPEGKELMGLFYAESEKVVEFLITQHGRANFGKFCELILKDKSFKEALINVYSSEYASLDEFNRAWVEYIIK